GNRFSRPSGTQGGEMLALPSTEVLGYSRPSLRDEEHLQVISEWLHGQRVIVETRVPMSRKRRTETRSALKTKPRDWSSTRKPSLAAASRNLGGNTEDIRNSTWASGSARSLSLEGNSMGRSAVDDRCALNSR